MLNDVRLSELVGGGYGAFWNFRGRYRVCKGSRASKKSKTAALWFMANLSKAKYREANLLVVRKTFRTLKDSCFAELKWAIHQLGLDGMWLAKVNPLEIINVRTGQRIYFRGLDDPLKVTSITVDVGCLCWMWVEECYEIINESDFDMLTESIRGEVPDGLFKQVTITFNPWNERHWLKRRFFDVQNPDVLAMTTNYMCNEWLDADDRRMFENMRVQNPRRYRVAGLGEWGISDGLVYENWREEEFTLEDLREKYRIESAFGLDFGYTNDPSALFAGFIDTKARKLFVWDEMYKTGMSNRKIFAEVKRMGYGKERITADSAEPKSIDELHGLGLRITAAAKGRDSVNSGIQFLQDHEIVVHPRCVNFLTEISNYTWAKDRFGKTENQPIDDFNHLMDAMRYGCERFIKARNTALTRQVVAANRTTPWRV